MGQDVNGGEYRIDSLVLHYPGNRCKINPAFMPELGAFLIVKSRRWEKQAHATNRGMSKAQRVQANAEKKAMRQIMKGIEHILRTMEESFDRADFIATEKILREPMKAVDWSLLEFPTPDSVRE